MRTPHTFDNRKSETCPDNLTGLNCFHTVEFIENSREIFLFNADPGIRNSRLHKSTFLFEMDPDLSSLMRIFDCIGNEVGENSFHTVPVRTDQRKLRWSCELEIQFFSFCLSPHQVHCSLV